MMKRLLLLLLLVIGSAVPTFATHLIGGNIGYIDLGQDPNIPANNLYRIVFQGYNDCNSPFWGTGFPEDPINVGIYSGTLNSNSLTNLGPGALGNLELNLTDSNRVEPNLPNNCNFGVTNCIYLVEYSGEVSLPRNTVVGYHIVYDRCCRPAGIVNVTNSLDESLTYHTYIPASGGTVIPNNTPQFTDTLVAYICIGDTITLSNTATDPDGDSLVFSLETPHDGMTNDVTNVAADYNAPNFNPYTYPIPEITWETGYSTPDIFGAGGYSVIDSQTGLTFFSATLAGNYAAAVEIKEYRNGQLLSVSRRNIQLLAVNCPPNDNPQQDISNLPSNAISPTIYEIEAGDNICFNLDFEDPDGDTIELQASGGLFNLANNPATITQPTSGVGQVSTQVCWNSTCAQASNQPYLFNVTVTDKGCPPKTNIQTFSLFVREFDEPEFTGDTVFCQGDTGIYTLTAEPGTTFQWQVNQGVLLSPVDSAGARVLWNGNNPGSITVVGTSQFGCDAAPVTQNIIIHPVFADAGTDPTICVGDTIAIGASPVGTANSVITWSPNTAISDVNAANPNVWPDQDISYIVQVDDTANGCVAFDTVNVTVNTLPETGLPEQDFICPGFTKEITAQGGGTYQWSNLPGISNPNIPNPQFNPATTTTYSITVTDTNGCVVTDTLQIVVEGEIPTFAGIDTNICRGDTIVLGGNPTSPGPDITYLWSPNASLDFDTLGNPLAFPIANTQYIVLTEMDTCRGADTVDITVLDPPVYSVTPSDTIICDADSIPLLVTGGDFYDWSNETLLSQDSIANPIAFPDTTTNFQLIVVSNSGCSDTSNILIRVQAPLEIVLSDTIPACKNSPVLIGGNPTALTGDVYQWSGGQFLDSDIIDAPTATIDTTTTFYVYVEDSIGCNDSDSIHVEVFRTTGHSPDTSFCDGQNIPLTFSTEQGVGPLLYTWFPTAGLSDTTSNTTLASPSVSTIYTVTAIDQLGCIDTAQFNLTVLDLARAGFTYSMYPTCENIEIEFLNTSTDATTFSWLYNGAEFSTEMDPTLSLPYSQPFTVQLVANNAEGCSTEITITDAASTFNEEFSYVIPNVFTPNGDGVNDFFEIDVDNRLKECTDISVFNRWGQLVFQSSGNVHSWDGRYFGGDEAPNGVYFYLFEVNGQTFKGSLNLYR